MSTLGTENDSLQEKESLTPADEVVINNEASVTTEQVETPEKEVEASVETPQPETPLVEEPQSEVPLKEEPQQEITVVEEVQNETILPEATEQATPAMDETEMGVEGKTDDSEMAVVETETIESNTEQQPDFSELTTKELVEKLKELLQAADADKNAVDSIKQIFYKKYKAEQQELLNKFVADGGEKEDFTAPKESVQLEEELRNLLAEFKAKRNEQHLKQLHEKDLNLNAKLQILDKLKALTDDLDSIENINEAIINVRNLQQEWKNIGPVAPDKSNELWKNYHLYIEKFYDYIKISNELREYDLKKNLEIKTALCEQAEKLVEEPDVLTAFRALQKMHEEWKETGPVARELREEIWERFKAASTLVNKKHQAYYDGKKEDEEKNLEAKTQLCEQVEAIDYSQLNSYKTWEDKTNEILAIQANWKQIGFAPKKVNVKIYERFRKACDEFFGRKNEFFQKAKSELSDNMAKKIALCEQAESLKDSTDWKETADKLIKIQKEWKTIGPVPRKLSDAIWKRFITACDYFFEQREKHNSVEKQGQEQNLQQKKDLIEKIENLEVTENPQEAVQKLKDMIAEWNSIGFVPFKEKDKIYKAFKRAVDNQFDKLNVDEHNRKLHMFKTNIEDIASEKSQHKLFREREKLKKELDYLTTEIATYENNIGFFSSSKKADKLIRDMEKKIEKLKSDKDLILKKIDLIENTL